MTYASVICVTKCAKKRAQKLSVELWCVKSPYAFLGLAIELLESLSHHIQLRVTVPLEHL